MAALGIEARTRRQTSKPSIPGIIQSSMAISGPVGSCSTRKASHPSPATRTSNPQLHRVAWIRRREVASSSAIRTRNSLLPQRFRLMQGTGEFFEGVRLADEPHGARQARFPYNIS